ncbi:MAG TPA: hypothetical protein VIK78_11165 [Ruminiclostridium sp.]
MRVLGTQQKPSKVIQITKSPSSCKAFKVRSFVFSFSTTSLEYTQKVRIDEVCKLLTKSDLKVIDIALQDLHPGSTEKKSDLN